MEKLKAKLKRQGGFTLVEMLIVVAIIAILIAVSIPLVGDSLEKARDATDQANERAAKAEAVLYFMGAVTDDELTALGNYTPGSALSAKYDAQNGKLVPTTDAVEPYGQCKGVTGKCYIPAGKTTAEAHDDCWINVSVTVDGTVTLTWGKT